MMSVSVTVKIGEDKEKADRDWSYVATSQETHEASRIWKRQGMILLLKS